MLNIHFLAKRLLPIFAGCLVFFLDFTHAADWSGDIADGTVWPSGEVQRIVGNATVPAGFTLTIQQGAIVKFNLGTSLFVDGTLNMGGTEGSPILMTSDTDDTGGDTNGDGGATTPEPGSWNKLEVRGTGSALLTWVNIRYGGDVSFSTTGNLRVDGGSLNYNNGSVTLSDSAGIHIVSAEPTISGVDFQDNRLSALRMDVDSDPVISTVSFSNNGVNGIALDGGTLSLSRGWDDPDAVILMTADVIVPEGLSLTVGPGQIVKPNIGVDLFIQGTLDVNGSPGSPVYFVASSDDSRGGDTNNDADQTMPGIGAWNRIDIASTASATLDWTHIAHGGDVSFSTTGNLRVDGGSLNYNNGSVTLSDSAGIHIVSAEPTISGVDFQDNRLSALRMDVDSDPVISTVSFSNNGVNGIALDGGTLSLSRGWDDPDAVILMTADVIVPEGLSLTVGPGQIVKPNIGVDLFIQGTLDVNGSPGSPVYFVASSDDSRGGDTNNDADQTMPGIGAWNRIDIASTASATLDWTHIAHGGDVSFSTTGNLRVDGGSLNYNNGSVTLSDSAGIHIVSAEPTISGVDFQDNRLSALRMDVDSDPVISTVSFSNNGVNGIALDGGTLSLSRGWDDPDAVILMTADVIVPEGLSLTVGPGQIVKPNIGVDLFIQGTLDVNGSPGSPVYFVASSDDSRGGDTNNDADQTMPGIGAWNRIDIASTASATLDWTHIAHGGDVSFATTGNLRVDGGSLNYNNGSVTLSDNAGIHIVSAEPTISGVDFQDNRLSALRMDVDSDPVISTVSFSNNGVNGIALDGGTLSLSRGWDDPDAVILMTADVTVPEGLSLTVGPGQIVKPKIGVDLFIQGALDADGTIDNPVIFTASADDANGGDTNNDAGGTTVNPGAWNRIFIATNGSATLDYAQISYAGDVSFSIQAALHVDGGIAVIQNCIVSHSNSRGVLVAGSGSVELTNSLVFGHAFSALETAGTGSATAINNTIDGSQNGVRIAGGLTTLVNNIVSNHSRAGIELTGGGSSDIRYNNVYNPSASMDDYVGLADPTGSDGNLSADPIFANASAGLFHILSSSTAIDSATSDSAPTLDFFGNPRFDDPGVENTGGGATTYFDMGAIERQEGSDPVNLVVDMVEVSQESGEIGDTVTIGWRVINLGSGPAPAPWSDAVFASLDQAWDINDVRVEEFEQQTTLFPGEFYTREVDVLIPPAMPGDLSFIVRTDYRQQVGEVEESNDVPLAITVDIPVIPLGGQVQATLSESRPERYFQVPLDQEELFEENGFPQIVGELSIGLDDVDDLGVNELYLGSNRIPSRSISDVRSLESGPDQMVTSFLSSPHTVIVLARAATLPAGDSVVDLSAELEPFSVTGFTPDSVGNAGKATIAINGVSFSGVGTVSLVAPDETEIPAESVYFEDTRRIYATFDTQGLDPGSYRVRVAQELVRFDLDQGEFTLPQTIEVTYGEEMFTTTSLNTLEVVAGGQPDIELLVSLPSRMRAAREFNYTLTYTNTGNLDATGRVLELSGTGGELFDPDLDYAHSGDLPLLALSNTGPAGTLRPGQSETVELQGLAPNTVGQTYTLTARDASATDGIGPDFDGFVSELGHNPAVEPWSSVVTDLEAQFGTSWPEFRSKLGQFASDHEVLTGERLHSVRALLSAEIDESLLAQGAFSTVSSQALPQTIVPSTTPPEDRVTSGNPRRGMTGKVVLRAPGTGTGSWPNRVLQFGLLVEYYANLPGCSGHNINYANNVVSKTMVGLAVRAGSVLPLQHIGLWSNAANSNQSELVHHPGSTASNLFLSTTKTQGGFNFTSVHQITTARAAKEIRDELQASAPILPVIPDFDVETGEPDWAFVQGLNDAAWAPHKTPAGQFALASSFGAMQGAAATVKDVGFKESPGEVIISGLIRYAFVDRFEFDADDASKGYFDRNFYVAEWCDLGTAAGFDTKVIVEKEFTHRYIPPDGIDPDLTSVTPGTEDGVSGDDTSDVVGGFDPNDKIGPAGFGDPAEGLIEPGEELFYMVRFENDPDLASAPAQRVAITDVLDENLDLSTFQLMSFGFGDTVVEAPPGQQAFDAHVDSSNLDGSPLRVDLSASLDTHNRIVTWIFDSIDPETGGAPTGIDDGFLPVNDETGQGEGFVTFRVLPKPDTPLGTKIFNHADIVFDQNEPIVTPTTVHTISTNDTIFADGFE